MLWDPLTFLFLPSVSHKGLYLRNETSPETTEFCSFVCFLLTTGSRVGHLSFDRFGPLVLSPSLLLIP